MTSARSLCTFAAGAALALGVTITPANPALERMTLGEFTTYPVVTPAMAHRAALLLEQGGYGVSHAGVIAQLRSLQAAQGGTVLNPLYVSSTGETAAQRFERHLTSYDCEYMPYPYDYLEEWGPAPAGNPWCGTGGLTNCWGFSDLPPVVDPGYSPVWQ